ncbi:MAG TPA: RNA polymerase sigma factor [Planctomycetaceae bacterium]|nr:RNA polymerase sigma factor [Planctomycetaceae bacterium]
MMESEDSTETESASGDATQNCGSGTSSAERLAPELVRELYHQHAAEMLAFLQGVLRDGDRAREALQNTFQRMLESGHTARLDSIRGWLFRVAFNEAMALRRRQSARDRTLQRFVSTQPPTEIETQLPETEIIRAEDVARLKEALKQLPADQREVVERRMHRDVTFAQIAADLKVPLGTVLTRMRLALQKLQKTLGRPPSKD